LSHAGCYAAAISIGCPSGLGGPTDRFESLMVGGLQIPHELRAQCTDLHLICAFEFNPQDECGSMVNPIDALVPVFARYHAYYT